MVVLSSDVLDNVSQFPILRLSKDKPSHQQLHNQNGVVVPKDVISLGITVIALRLLVPLSVVQVAPDGVLVLVAWDNVLMSLQYKNLAPVLHSKLMTIPVNLTAVTIWNMLTINSNVRNVLRPLFLTIVSNPQGLLVGNAQRLYGMLFLSVILCLTLSENSHVLLTN